MLGLQSEAHRKLVCQIVSLALDNYGSMLHCSSATRAQTYIVRNKHPVGYTSRPTHRGAVQERKQPLAAVPVVPVKIDTNIPPRNLGASSRWKHAGELFFFKRVFFRIFICGLKSLETFGVRQKNEKNSEDVWQIVGQTETKGMDLCVHS